MCAVCTEYGTMSIQHRHTQTHNHQHQLELTWPFSTWTLFTAPCECHRLHRRLSHSDSVCAMHFVVGPHSSSVARLSLSPSLRPLFYFANLSSANDIQRAQPTNDLRLVSFRCDVHLIYIRRWLVLPWSPSSASASSSASSSLPLNALAKPIEVYLPFSSIRRESTASRWMEKRATKGERSKKKLLWRQFPPDILIWIWRFPRAYCVDFYHELWREHWQHQKWQWRTHRTNENGLTIENEIRWNRMRYFSSI